MSSTTAGVAVAVRAAQGADENDQVCWYKHVAKCTWPCAVFQLAKLLIIWPDKTKMVTGYKFWRPPWRSLPEVMPPLWHAMSLINNKICQFWVLHHVVQESGERWGPTLFWRDIQQFCWWCPWLKIIRHPLSFFLTQLWVDWLSQYVPSCQMLHLVLDQSNKWADNYSHLGQWKWQGSLSIVIISMCTTLPWADTAGSW